MPFETTTPNPAWATRSSFAEWISNDPSGGGKNILSRRFFEVLELLTKDCSFQVLVPVVTTKLRKTGEESSPANSTLLEHQSTSPWLLITRLLMFDAMETLCWESLEEW